MTKKFEINIFSLTVAVLFLYPILPQYVYIIGGINVVNGLLALFLAIYVLWYKKLAKIGIKNNIPFYWLFLIVMAVSYFTDAGILKTITYVMSFILLPWILISIINTEERFFKVIDALIAGGAFLGILGIAEALLKFNFIQPLASGDIEFFHEIRYGLLRIMTTFGQPIAYGLYQVFIVALINYKNSVFGGSRRLKICYLISVLNVFLSVSRTPIIAFIVIQLLFWHRESKKKFTNYIFFALIGALILLIASTSFGFKIPLIDDLLETINQLLSGNTASSGSTVGVGNRFDLWAWVYLSMGNKWLMGHGPTAEFAYKVYEWQTKTSIENQYLNILWHNGLVGLVLLILSYLSILIYSLKKRFHYILKSGETISFNMCVFLTMLTYYVVEFGVQESDMARIYTVFVALLIAYNRIASSKAEVEE